MRRATIYYKDVIAGVLTETDEGEYVFEYDAGYRELYPKQFLTFTMPVDGGPYRAKRLFSFFEGLIPEGWITASLLSQLYWRSKRRTNC